MEEHHAVLRRLLPWGLAILAVLGVLLVVWVPMLLVPVLMGWLMALAGWLHARRVWQAMETSCIGPGKSSVTPK